MLLNATTMTMKDLLQRPPPRHLRSRGEEGFRTPTFEDAEHDLSTGSNGNLLSPPTAQALRDAHTSALESLQGSTPRVINGTVARKDSKINDTESTDHAETDSSSIVNLSWRERIRHFTWAYFTLTMATGGIANALYAGQ